MKPLRIIFSVLIILFRIETSAVNYPDIHENRPRIWADSARFSWLQGNMNSGECGSTYTYFRYRYDNYWITDPQLYLAGTDSIYWTWDWSSVYAGDEAVFTAFLTRLTGETIMLERSVFVLNRIVHAVDTANFPGMEWYARETLLRKLSDATGTMLDWCYNLLPPNKRQRLAQALYKMNKEFMQTYILSSSGNSYVSSHNAYNCVETMQNAIVLFNADGLNQGKKDTVVNWFHTLYDKWMNGFFPCYGYYRNTDGGWNWGAAYSMWSLTDQFKLFDNMLFGTTKNLYQDLPWVQNSINQYWYFIQPNLYSIHLGDGVAGFWADNVVYRHAAVFQDNRSRWLTQQYGQQQYLTWTYPVFAKLIYKDFTLPDVSKPDLPLYWFSDKVGLSVARTDWDSTSAMVWFFNSPSKKASHEHRDNNTFAVYKWGPLLIDAGYYDYYGSSHFMNYYTRSIAHNTVCVFDTADQYYYGSVPASNDGGQKWSDAMQNYSDIFAIPFQRGNWLNYGQGTDYQLSVGDASISYDSLKVKKFTRRFLFYRDDMIIVLDHLIIKNPFHPTRKTEWILHSTLKPDVHGLVVSSPVPGHIEYFSGTDYTITNGNGTASVRTICPADCLVRRIGGSGFEYWVNGTNYPPSVQPDTVFSTPGAWRLEVIPQAQKDSVMFFHTIKLGDINHPSSPGGILKNNQYTAGTDWNNTLFFFNRQGQMNVHFHRMDSVGGNRTAGLFAADLVPFRLYRILVDSNEVNALSADSAGVIQCQLDLGSGAHSVVISEILVGSSSLENNSGKPLVKVYPNPAGDILVLEPLQNPPRFLYIRLLNGEGKTVRTYQIKTTTVIPLSGIPWGQYVVVAESGNDSQQVSVIIRKQ